MPPRRVVYVRNATVVRVIDGDTVALRIDLGWRLSADYSCRIVLDEDASIDTPERGRPGHAEATATARALLPPGTDVTVESLRMTDKYGGRFDGTVFLPDGRNFAQAMIDAGVAARWAYGEPKPYARAGA